MLYLNGNWQEGEGASFTSLNPSTQEPLWQGRAASAAQVEAAYEAAAHAFADWSQRSFDERRAYLTAFRDQVDARKDELTRLISEEIGKAPWDAASEVAALLGKLAFSEKAYAERTPTREQVLANGSVAHLTHRPHGVMAVFGPYNFPAHLPNGHIMPAMLAGNVVLFKPSELSPAVGEWLMRRWEEVNLPAGVLQLLQGERETGVVLAAQKLDGLLFTGSVNTGKKIHELFAGRPETIIALELGGNNPLIIDQISDIKSAVLETILSAYISSGQRCTCARRLIVVEQPNTPAYLEALAHTASQLIVDAPDATPAPFMGPVISNHAAEALLSAQTTLLKQGAKPLLSARRLHENRPFLTPALLDVTGLGTVTDEEYFGPLLQLIRVPDLDTAIHVANQTRFGLSAGVLSDDAARFAYCAARLRAGIINWNQQTTGASGGAPFGGVGQSGNHRPAGYYAADYCAYPVAGVQRERLALPDSLPPGLTLS